MEWTRYFQLRVTRETRNGTHPYFQADLTVPASFSMEDLNLKCFENLGLSEDELKSMTLVQRKILLRHHYFLSKEFERIAHNFMERIMSEKDPLLKFSTRGGGIYLFIHLLKEPSATRGRLIQCQTNEIPLPIFGIRDVSNASLQLSYRPELVSVFDRLPSLWENSALMALFEVDEQKVRAA